MQPQMLRMRLLAAALLAALLAAPTRACDVTLAMPAASAAVAATSPVTSWCSPFALTNRATTTCSSPTLVVPPGSVLSFGTCALPGAACSGATNLTLLDASGATLLSLDRVALDSSVAALSKGCVLGVRCSYGEWRSAALAPTPVAIREACHLGTACAGVTAWRLDTPPELLPALASSNASALVFTVTAAPGAPATTVTRLHGAALGATVTISYRAGAFSNATLASASGWTQMGIGASTTLPATGLPLPAGGVITVLVRVTSGSALSCAHALGTPLASVLLADAAVSVSQGGAVTNALAAGAALGVPCAWAGLSLAYASPAACPPPSPPPLPNIPTLEPDSLVRSLDDLMRALANPAVTSIEIISHIALNGSELTVALDGNRPRTLLVEGTYACVASDPPLCSLDARGASRVFNIAEGVSLRIAHLLLANGAAPPDGFGGCVFADAASLALDSVTLRNCSAPAGGGGVAVLDGGALRVHGSAFLGCASVVGGGALVSHGDAAVNASSFEGNLARGASTGISVSLGSLPGPVGGGLALWNCTANVTDTSFTANVAQTSDIVLLPNPDAGQARGGGLFIGVSVVNVTGCTFSQCDAFFGGAVNVKSSAVIVSASAFDHNFASIGFGGALFARDSPSVRVEACLLSHNLAGGRMGGALGAIRSGLTVTGCVLTDNSAPNGCGGAIGLDAAATLHLGGNSVIARSAAQSGGALCCNLCTASYAADSVLYDNEATSGAGGAAAADASPSYFTNVTLSGNTAPRGGAISAVASSLNLTDCTLRGNAATATHGGAVLHDATEDPAALLVASGTMLANNTAAAGGGAVAAFSSASAVLSMCDFANNSITGPSPSGGAMLSLDVALLVLANTTFTANFIEVVAAVPADAAWGYTAVPIARSSGFGGALWLTSNVPTVASITGCTFERNSAPSGGGAYLTGAVTLAESWSTFSENVATDFSGVGGGLATDAAVVATLTATTFDGCVGVRGGGAWHGGASSAAYDGCTFVRNFGALGDDVKGGAMHVTDAARVTVTRSFFVNNTGVSVNDGAVVLGGDKLSHLSIANSTFDGNDANLGGALFVTAHSQRDQLALSGILFRKNYAQVASILFTEAAIFEPLNCAPVECDYLAHNNTAKGGRQLTATPPTQIAVNMSARMRSGAQLPLTLRLIDGFHQALKEWPDTTATLETTAQMTGSMRSFFHDGVADFPGLTLKGSVNASYNLTLTVTGPELFGSGLDSMNVTVNVTVQACEEGEEFDAIELACTCAEGYGLVVETGACELCGDNQVVPHDAIVKSCATCPPLSAPDGLKDCRCNAGYFGSIFGVTGVCTQCPMNSYRAASDPPASCRSCPNTSQTFSLGTASAAGCMCGTGSFTDHRGSTNGSFTCSAVPDGGWSPVGDPRLFSLADFWRPNETYSTFFRCTAGNCLREVPITNTTQTGHACRVGHTGHLCAVCEHSYAYQGVFCSKCDAGATFQEWPVGKAVALLLFGLLLLIAVTYLLFFLPLCPRVEAALAKLIEPAVNRVGEVVSGMVARRSRPSVARMSGASRASGTRLSVRLSAHNGAAHAPPADGHHAHPHPHPHLSGRPNSPLRPGSSSKRPGSASNRVGGKDAPTPQALGAARGKRKLAAVLDVIAEPLRIIQIISSFSNSLAVPWPSVYYSLASALSVVSVQLLRLPNVACIQPEVSFYTVFDGITITMLLFIVFCGATYHFGSRTEICKTDLERKRRFKSRCVNNLIWSLFLVYPQVSATTLQIFSCVELEDGTAWLTADLREQCWRVHGLCSGGVQAPRRVYVGILNPFLWCARYATHRSPKHKLHVGVGVGWTLLYPFGIPCMLLFALHRAGVPQLATWKRDCAWLRAIAQRALVLRVALPDVLDVDTLTTECVTIQQLRVLHTLFVAPEPSLTAPLRKVVTVRVGDDATADPPAPLLLMSSDAPRKPSPGGSRTTSVRMPSSLARVPDQPLSPSARALLWLRRLRVGAVKLAAASTRVARTRLSGMLWSDERQQLLGALLAWAKLDEGSLVAEPRDNQLRWRTQHEWDALRANEARLGEKDVMEMRAYQRLSFIFSSYACRAYWWESVDLLQKLFLTSVLTFIAPRSSVQIIAACLFAFAMLLVTLQVKPYRSASGNQLAALSQINIFLFLFCGLLLNTDPEGIAGERILFAVLIGALTTSIVGFSMFIFLRELFQQLLRALYGYDEEDEEDEEWDEEGEEYGADGNGGDAHEGYEGAVVLHHLEGVRESEEGEADLAIAEHEAPPALAIASGEHDGEHASTRAEELAALAAAAGATAATPPRERQGEPGDSGWR